MSDNQRRVTPVPEKGRSIVDDIARTITTSAQAYHAQSDTKDEGDMARFIAISVYRNHIEPVQ